MQILTAYSYKHVLHVFCIRQTGTDLLTLIKISALQVPFLKTKMEAKQFRNEIEISSLKAKQREEKYSVGAFDQSG